MKSRAKFGSAWAESRLDIEARDLRKAHRRLNRRLRKASVAFARAASQFKLLGMATRGAIASLESMVRALGVAS